MVNFWDKQNKKSLSTNVKAINIVYCALKMMGLYNVYLLKYKAYFDIFTISQTKVVAMLKNPEY